MRSAQGSSVQAQVPLTREEARQTGIDAYIYGYPLVLVDVTRQVATAVGRAGENRRAPINQFNHIRTFPDHTVTDIVSPNADTLYSAAWLDLSTAPMILSVPNMGTRYYLMMLMDAWTNVFASPGTRTTGNGEAAFAIVGPGWKGKLPPAVLQIRSPTNIVFVGGRTKTDGKDDYITVHALQDEYTLTPLSAWGQRYTPPTNVPVETSLDVRTPPFHQVGKMNAEQFFARLNSLMKTNPPAAADVPSLARFATIGIAPGKPFDLKSSKLDPSVVKGLEESVNAGHAAIIAAANRPRSSKVNGWDVLPANTGNFGTAYLSRAVVAHISLGANLPADATYARASVDLDGQPLSGASRYEICFSRRELPPVRAFWSITMYNDKQAFVANPLDRYAIGDRDKLTFTSDGSLTVYVQHQSPGPDKESNWLPAPSGSFNLVMRLYWPKKEILDGTWKIPPVEWVG